jgi:hypothetical protein
MTMPVVKQLSGLDGSYEKDRVAFGHLLGITKEWGMEIWRVRGEDDTVIDHMDMDKGPENDYDDVGEAELDEGPGKGLVCVPKTEDMRKFIGALSSNERGKIFHPWCYISRPLITSTMIGKKKSVYVLLNALITTVFTQAHRGSHSDFIDLSLGERIPRHQVATQPVLQADDK